LETLNRGESYSYYSESTPKNLVDMELNRELVNFNNSPKFNKNIEKGRIFKDNTNEIK